MHCKADKCSLFLQAISVKGLRENLQTDYTLKVIFISRAEIIFPFHIHEMLYQFTRELFPLLLRFLDLIYVPNQWWEML